MPKRKSIGTMIAEIEEQLEYVRKMNAETWAFGELLKVLPKEQQKSAIKAFLVKRGMKEYIKYLK